MSRHSLAISSPAAAACLALLASPALGDVLIDEFSHAGIYTNPWPYEQIGPGAQDFYESVAAGTILGTAGRIRETTVHSTMFLEPGVDIAVMGVNTDNGSFDYTATDGVANALDFAYGYVIMNSLHANFSSERGLRIDFRELTFGPEPELRVAGRLIDADHNVPHALSPECFLTSGGPQYAFIPFEDFEGIELIDLSDVGGLAVYLWIPAGTEFRIERIVAAWPDPGDANGDGVVDVLDILAILTAWGPCAGCLADFNDDGVVNVEDLLTVLANWT